MRHLMASFHDFILEQLADLPGLTCRSMFGGYGLYQGDTFFAIISDGRLYFKTNATSAAAYIAQGMEPFRASETQVLRNYYEVPAGVIEDSEELVVWARAAIRCQAEAKAARPPKPGGHNTRFGQ